VLSLGYLALATRALGLEGFGKFVLAVSFSQAITGLASFQTWQAVVRWGHGREDPAEAVGFALALDLVTVVAGSIGAGLLLCLPATGCRPAALRTRRSGSRRHAARSPLDADRDPAPARPLCAGGDRRRGDSGGRLVGAAACSCSPDQRRVRDRLGRRRAGHRASPTGASRCARPLPLRKVSLDACRARRRTPGGSSGARACRARC
jgi:hypothetical protein